MVKLIANQVMLKIVFPVTSSVERRHHFNFWIRAVVYNNVGLKHATQERILQRIKI